MMETQLTVRTELLQLFRSLLPGLICGVLFDVFRTLRTILPHHAAAIFLEDAFFSFTACFLLQCYAWSFCNGALRWQHAAGMLTGFLLYLLTAGAVWVRILRRSERFFRRIRQAVCRIFRKPPPAPEKNL